MNNLAYDLKNLAFSQGEGSHMTKAQRHQGQMMRGSFMPWAISSIPRDPLSRSTLRFRWDAGLQRRECCNN